MFGVAIADKAIKYLEDNTPKWLKICIALVIVGWMTPLKVRDYAKEFVVENVHATISPMKIQRDAEIKAINVRMDVIETNAKETNAFVKAMALEQLGAKRYQQVELTAVDKGK